MRLLSIFRPIRNQMPRAFVGALARRSADGVGKTRAGMTLAEVIVVMAILSIVAAISLAVSMDSYRGYAFRGDRDMLVAVLQKARSQAINNICRGSSCTNGKPHGVHFASPGQYVIFEGTDFADRKSVV